jgi:hypothetical protein
MRLIHLSGGQFPVRDRLVTQGEQARAERLRRTNPSETNPPTATVHTTDAESRYMEYVSEVERFSMRLVPELPELPEFTVAEMQGLVGYRKTEDFQATVEGLRMSMEEPR